MRFKKIYPTTTSSHLPLLSSLTFFLLSVHLNGFLCDKCDRVHICETMFILINTI